MAADELHSLCASCAKFNFGPGRYREGRIVRRFRKSLQHLESSASSGCHLCMLIFTSLAPQNGADDSWKKELDGPITCTYSESGDPHLLVKWGLGTRIFKLSSLPCPKGLRRSTIPTLQPSSPLQHDNIESSSRSPVIFSRISKWLEACIESHPNCQTTSLSILPKRVIDVGSYEPPRDPRLFISDGKAAKYAALSYRWGTAPTLTTTSENLDSHVSGIKLEDFPRTLRDAIVVGRNLGLQYLWIDALCIIQDSPEDWAEQAGKMAGIYQYAHLTISADSAESSDSGFLADRNIQAIRSCRHSGMRTMIHPYIPEVFDIINVGGLSQRGWVLQERVFSCRMIHWSHLEVGWECREMQASERDPRGQVNMAWLGSDMRSMLIPKPQDLFLDEMHHLSQGSSLSQKAYHSSIGIYDAWYILVGEYSRRLLTYPDKDKLIALSSIAKTFYKRHAHVLGPEQSYISGLWKGDLAMGLSFKYGTGYLGRQQLGLPQVADCNLEDPSTWDHRPPSFSWTRADGSATWAWDGGDKQGRGHSLPEYDIEVLDVHNMTTGGNHWGPIESCWVLLRGVMCSREMMRTNSYQMSPDDDTSNFESLQREFYLRLRVLSDLRVSMSRYG